MSNVILVTGANTGLGLAIVRALYSSQTATIILLGCRSIEKGQTALGGFQSVRPGNISTKIEVLQINIEEDASINAAAHTVDKRFGKLDVLVNNAGKSSGIPRCLDTN